MIHHRHNVIIKLYIMAQTEFYSKSSVAGDYSGLLFDDLENMLATKMLPRGIRVRMGDVIDSIEMVYDKSDYPIGKSPFFHGGPNGYTYFFSIPDGDSLRTVDIEYGKYIYSLDPNQRKKDQIVRIRFTTHKGVQSQWYGNACGKGDSLPTKPFKIDVGEDNVICCFYGATGLPNMTLHNYLQAIGVYVISYLNAKRVYSL